MNTGDYSIEQAIADRHDKEAKFGLPTRTIRFQFRWPVRPVDPDGSPRGDTSTMVEMKVPCGGSEPILNPRFTDGHLLTDRQVEECENAVIRHIAIIPE